MIFEGGLVEFDEIKERERIWLKIDFWTKIRVRSLDVSSEIERESDDRIFELSLNFENFEVFDLKFIEDY